MLANITHQRSCNEIIVLVDDILHCYLWLFGRVWLVSRCLDYLGVNTLLSQFFLHFVKRLSNLFVLVVDFLQKSVAMLSHQPLFKHLLLYLRFILSSELSHSIFQPQLYFLSFSQKSLVYKENPCEPFNIHKVLADLLRLPNGFTHEIDE